MTYSGRYPSHLRRNLATNGESYERPTYIFVAQVRVYVFIDMGSADLVRTEVLVLYEEVATESYTVGCFEVEAVVVEVVVGRNGDLYKKQLSDNESDKRQADLSRTTMGRRDAKEKRQTYLRESQKERRTDK